MQEEQPQPTEGLKEINALGLKIFSQKEVIGVVKERLQVEQAKLAELETQMLTSLEAAETEKIHVPGLGTLYVKHYSSVKVPKTAPEKEAFFAFLKERGIFEDMITVNSRTLNSFYEAEEAKAVEEGNEDFSMPGIESATITQKIMTRKK